MHDWPLVALGDILTPSIDRHPVEAGKLYPNIGIYGFGRGVFEKPPIDGGSTSASALFRVKAGQLIYSRLFAFEGAYALVPDSADGAYVSNEYPAFEIDADRVVPEFLGWLFRLPGLWESLAALTSGMGDRRRRLHPERFLTYQIHLPPQSERRAIVADLNAVAGRISDVQRLRREVQNDLGALMVTMSHRNDLSPDAKRRAGWIQIQLGDVILQAIRSVDVRADAHYRNLGIYSFGKGLFKKPPIDGARTSANRLYEVRVGDFIYSRLFAFEGAFALVEPEFDGFYVSNEYPAFLCVEEQVIPEFLIAYFKAPKAWEMLAGHAVGLGDRRKRIKPETVLSHNLWLPPLTWQQKIKATVERIGEATKRRIATDRELNAVLPAVLDRALRGKL